jgi:predicted CXXCH cytochrome family protein
MKKSFYIQISGILLLSLIFAPFSTAGTGHGTCVYCHINAAPVAGNAGLRSPYPQLCINCHPDRVGKAEHVIDVKPVTAMAIPLPLWNGRLTCTTCHDPHSDSPLLLRVEQASLCRACHLNK